MAVLEGHNMKKIENAIIFPSTLEKIGWNILDASLGFVVLVKSWKAKKIAKKCSHVLCDPQAFSESYTIF